jgi:hypothetical protein
LDGHKHLTAILPFAFLYKNGVLGINISYSVLEKNYKKSKFDDILDPSYPQRLGTAAIMDVHVIA